MHPALVVGFWGAKEKSGGKDSGCGVLADRRGDTKKNFTDNLFVAAFSHPPPSSFTMAGELKFVNEDAARGLRAKHTHEDKSMAHYWEKAATYVIQQQQRSFARHKFNDEFAAFEKKYFAGLDPTARMFMNMELQQGANRMEKWMQFTV